MTTQHERYIDDDYRIAFDHTWNGDNGMPISTAWACLDCHRVGSAQLSGKARSDAEWHSVYCEGEASDQGATMALRRLEEVAG